MDFDRPPGVSVSGWDVPDLIWVSAGKSSVDESDEGSDGNGEEF